MTAKYQGNKPSSALNQEQIPAEITLGINFTSRGVLDSASAGERPIYVR